MSAGWLPVLVLLAGCAFPGRAEPEPGPEPDPGVDASLAIEALQAAEADLEDGRYTEAAATADSLYLAWSPHRSLASLADRALWLGARALEADGRLGEATASLDLLVGRVETGEIRDQAIARLAELWARTGTSHRAADLLLRTPPLDAPRLELLRDLANGLTLVEVQSLAEQYPADSEGAAVVHVQLAQLLIVENRADSARRVARRALAAGPAGPERDVATLIAESSGSFTGATVRVGAILPLSGRFGGVGQLLEEGIELAIEAYEARTEAGFDIQLLVRDDGSEPERAPALLTELEREGVVAVIGPIGSESFAAALRARVNKRMLVLSPTATEVLEPSENAYTLYDRARQERDVAADLAEWSVRELGLRRTAMLYPLDPTGRATAGTFETTLRRANVDVLASSTYHPDSTTFRDEIESLARLEPDVVFVAAPSPQSVLTLAPQLYYYHLDHSIIIGSSAWAEPAVLRRLARNDGDYRILGLWVDRTSPGTPWQRFALDYERKYRKSLRDNILPGLSHDAMTLVLSALDQARLPIPAALSAVLGRGSEVVGVTGRLQPDAGTSTVGRATQIRMLYDGQLLRPDRDRLLTWLVEARVAAIERREREKEDPPR